MIKNIMKEKYQWLKTDDTTEQNLNSETTTISSTKIKNKEETAKLFVWLSLQLFNVYDW